MVETIKLSVYKEDKDWLIEFSRFHKITTQENTIHKLIEIHKAWNRML